MQRFSVANPSSKELEFQLSSFLLEDYPHLTRDDIQACLRYAVNFLKNDIYIDLEAA
jgi:hypothetical protein